MPVIDFDHKRLAATRWACRPRPMRPSVSDNVFLAGQMHREEVVRERPFQYQALRQWPSVGGPGTWSWNGTGTQTDLLCSNPACSDHERLPLK